VKLPKDFKCSLSLGRVLNKSLADPSCSGPADMPLVCLKVEFLNELLSHCEYILLAPHVDLKNVSNDVSVAKLQLLVRCSRVRL
jgi:hypothetical protein